MTAIPPLARAAWTSVSGVFHTFRAQLHDVCDDALVLEQWRSL